MSEVKWSPYIPTYPNVQIPAKKELSDVRVVEPSTRSSVKMNLLESLEDRVERARQVQQNAAVLRYDQNGNRVLSLPNSHGYIIDIAI